MTDTITATKTPRQILATYDRFMSGLSVTDDEKAIADAAARAASFGVAAYEAGIDADQGARAMARAFLCALIDPQRPDLDYLRSDPAAAQEARND